MTICGKCGREFQRPHDRGPAPSYCSPTCRQAAYVRRLVERQMDAVSDDELFDEVVKRMESDLPAWGRRVQGLLMEVLAR